MNEDIIFNKEKFKACIHYIIDRCGSNKNVGRTVIYKLLYFSDFNFYEIYEKSLTGEKYIRKPRGPVPKHFIEAKNELINENKIKEEEIKVINYNKYDYSSLTKPSLDLLNNNEINVINDVINKLSHMKSGQISDYSHGDIPWKVANIDEELDYEFVFYRAPEYSVRVYDD